MYNVSYVVVVFEFGMSEVLGFVMGGMVGDVMCVVDDGVVEGEYVGVLEELGGGE